MTTQLVAAPKPALFSTPTKEASHGDQPEKMLLLKSELIGILKNRLLNESSKLSQNMNSILAFQEQLEGAVTSLMQTLTSNKAVPQGAEEHAEKIKSSARELRVYWTNDRS